MSGEPVTLGLDVGTSGLKAVALTASGEAVAEASADYPLHTPRPGWTEQDPADWWAAAQRALAELVARVGAEHVRAVAPSGQMHGLVALDERGEPVRRALLWNDQRTGDAVQEMVERVGTETLVARGGNPPVTGFQLPKLLWLRAHEPDAFTRVRHTLFPKDWITFRLTGEAVSEPTDASGSNAFLLAEGRWDEEVLGALDLDPGLFPRVAASDAVVGEVTQAAAAATGLRAGTPVVAGAGDNAAASTALGLGRHAPETGSVSLGTSGVLFAPLTRPTPEPRGRVHLFAHADGGWNLLGVTLAATGSLSWLQRTLATEYGVEELVALAAQRPLGANGVVFTPYLAGERSPFLDPELRGGFQGLSLATDLGDLVRAVLEGVAFSLRDVAAVMQPLTGVRHLLATGGGSRSETWRQIVADVLQLPLGVPAHAPGAAHGAATLAWRALGETLPAPEVTGWTQPASLDVYRAAYARYREHAPSLSP